MICYMIEHIPSGLYFNHTKKFKDKKEKFSYKKTNLSKVGRVYQTKPTEKQLQLWVSGYYDTKGDLIIVNKEHVLKVWKVKEVELK